MQAIVTLTLYALISLSIAGWFNLFGPEYTWWNVIYILGN